jgi:hypothetical protein
MARLIRIVGGGQTGVDQTALREFATPASGSAFAATQEAYGGAGDNAMARVE